jgi:RNA recognition motif-containing protein
MYLEVKNIEQKVNEVELERLFNPFGAVLETNIIYNTTTWERQGNAFIEMENNKEAINAMEHLNGVKLHGKAIIVQEAQIVAHKE